jgi:peptidoglycan-associated lipoprotein
MNLIATTLLVSGLLVLAGCDVPAGSETDEGGFGNPTMNNYLLETGQINYTVSLNRRFTSEVPATVNFEFDSSALDGEAQQVLMRQADWIRQFPEVRFRVYGYTDLVGSNAYNKSLGMRRAQNVVSFLVSQGISRSRLQAVVSYGETHPIIETQEPERRNRRAVTEVSGFVSRHPTVLNGKYAAIIHREYIASAVPVSTLGVAGTVSDAGSGQ